MREYFPEPSALERNVKVKLDLKNADLKNATVDITKLDKYSICSSWFN